MEWIDAYSPVIALGAFGFALIFRALSDHLQGEEEQSTVEDINRPLDDGEIGI